MIFLVLKIITTKMHTFFFLDNTEPPTIQTVDNYIINLATLLKTGSYPSLISNVKKVVSNLDFSQL